MTEIYSGLIKEAQYALKSHSLMLTYQVYGKATMARRLGAITREEMEELNTMLVRKGMNNAAAGLE